MIYNCRYCFPFGRPEGALKATLSLLERVGTAYITNIEHLDLWFPFTHKIHKTMNPEYLNNIF